MEEALEACEAEAREYVTGQALRNNAELVEVSVDQDRSVFGYSVDAVLYEVTMVVTAAGKPKIL